MKKYWWMLAVVLNLAIILGGCGGGGGSNGSNGNNNDDGNSGGLTIKPGITFLLPGESQQFTASLAGVTTTAVTWEVVEKENGGSITPQGVYTAPPVAVGTYHVKATSQTDSSKSATATIYSGLGYNYSNAEVFNVTKIHMVIDDSLSYDFSEGVGLEYQYRADHYYKEDISYNNFKLHKISLTDKSWYWITWNGETGTVSGSLTHQEDRYSYEYLKIAQTDMRVANTQEKIVNCYIKLIVDRENGTYQLEFNGVELAATQTWQDFVSGDYQGPDAITEPSFSCKVTDIPLPIVDHSRLSGSKTVPIKVFSDKDLYIDATVSWDLSVAE